MNKLDDMPLATRTKVWWGILQDCISSAVAGFRNFRQKQYANSVEQLYPSHQGVYTFDKRDYENLLRSNKILLDQAATILMMDEKAFGLSMRPLLEYLAKYCLKLPASQSYHHVQPGSLFFHLVETGNLAAERAKAHPELMMHTDAASRSNYEAYFPLGAWLLGVLHDIAKPMTDMEIYPLDKLGHPIPTHPWAADEETLHDFLIRHKASRYKMLYRANREYHLHDQYRVWFIQKLLSFFSDDSGYRRPLKHLIPTHASGKHPLNYIVKEADRISTKRDTLRYRPVPAISNYAKAFVDVLQDYDTVKRIDDVVSLPYFFSDWAIHIPFPDGVRVIIKQVSNRYAPYSDIPIPEDPDAWANLLGSEHSLLVANQRASDYRSIRYPDINHWVYDVVTAPGTLEQEHFRVISLSLEHVFLTKPVGPRKKVVTFASMLKHVPSPKPSTPAEEKLATQSEEKAMPKRKKRSSAPPAKQPELPEIDIQRQDTDVRPSNDDIDRAFELSEPDYLSEMPPYFDERYDAEPEVTALPPQTPQPPINITDDPPAPALQQDGQVEATIAPPTPRAVPEFDLSTLSTLSIVDKAKPKSAKKTEDTEVPKASTPPQKKESISGLTHDPIEIFAVGERDTAIATREYIKQIPENHVLTALFFDQVLIYSDEAKLCLLHIFNELQEMTIEELFAKKHRAYQITPEGLMVFVQHLNKTLLTGPFGEPLNQQLQAFLESTVKGAKTDIYHRIFKEQKRRGYRFFSDDITTVLLAKDKAKVEDYFTAVQEEIHHEG